MDTTPLRGSSSEEEVPVAGYRWRLLLPLAALVVLLLRGQTSTQLRAGLSQSTKLFIGEGNGELPVSDPDAENPFLYERSPAKATARLPVLHRGYDCWQPCLGAGICSNFCGPGNACCREGASNDPPECDLVTDFWTKHHECVQPVVPVKVHHYGQDCWERCEIGGDCEWCGGGQACCRKNSTVDPPECHGVQKWSTDRHHTCVTPVKEVEVKHEGQDCLNFCEGWGHCNWCGPGNACCKYGDENAVPECRAVVYYSSTKHYVCVKPTYPKNTTQVKERNCTKEGLVKGASGCVPAKKPQLLRFYVYRLGNASAPSATNAVTGSIGAIMYEIHTKILGCPRKEGIDRIYRFQVTMKNTEEAFRSQHHRFGPLHDFRDGQCISSNCEQTFKDFGYTVGCGEAPGVYSYVTGAHFPAWYSLPGECPLRAHKDKTAACREEFPGGECESVEGERDCTFHVQAAGNVTLDELIGGDLEGRSFQQWCDDGNFEYARSANRGVGTEFWDHLHNASLGKERMYKLAYLFWKKNPDFPPRLPELCNRTS